MYFDYLKEKDRKNAIIKDYGFCTYIISGKECFLADIYIKPEFRNQKKGTEILNELIVAAKSEGCEVITAREYPHTDVTSNSMLCALTNGFKIISSNSEFILIAKGIL